LKFFLIESSSNDEKKKAYWERECLCIVRERTTLQRTEEELSMAKRGLTLENERARAENEYRQLTYLSGILIFSRNTKTFLRSSISAEI
jgi:hypothetical protein